MNYQALIGKITEYLHLCASELSKWLEVRLPRTFGDDWWNTGVMRSLSYHQQDIVKRNNIHTLPELDLSALLRVTEFCWNTMYSRFHLTRQDRMTVLKMKRVRNNWAHTPTLTPQLSEIIQDLQTIYDFLVFIAIKRDILFAFEKNLFDVKANGIADTVYSSLRENKETPAELPPIANEIAVNTIVRLVSDKNITGMVISADAIGDTKRYKVFVDGKVREFFEGQIEIKEQNDGFVFSNISKVRRVLTAYQIRKPSSDSLYSLNAARIDFVPYQFRPALKFIKSDTPRLLIADSVGVGKTIEAGLLLKEMQARTSLDTVIVVCPKPLVAERKWELEMKRFDEDFTAVDGSLLRHIIQEANRDGEWPDKYKRLIIPYSLLTEDLLSGDKKKRRPVPGLAELDPLPFFDMVIVDEAHHVRNSSTQAYKVVKFFCENANAAVFLTATPIQLGNQDLFSLLNLLYPNTVLDKPTFNSMALPNGYINKALHYLRIPDHEREALDELNKAIETEWGRKIIAVNPVYKQAALTLSQGKISRTERVELINKVESLHSFAHMINRTRRQDIEDFCVRRAYTLQSKFTVRQRQLHDELLDFVSAVMSALHPSISLKFLMCTIRRQAASCIFGLAPLIKDIVERGLNSLTDDYDIQDNIENTPLNITEFENLAENVIALAENLPMEDSKFDSLAEIIRERQQHEDNKMIIFSTFRHTIKYLHKKINAMGGIKAEYIYGDVKDETRYELRERFELPKKDPRALDILLFTEVGSEGLDYQFCDTLVNYDIPWNPMRVEQRIGRIDRRGQKSDVAHIYNCIVQNTIDEEIHERCLRRIGIFEHSIGDCSEILGSLAKSIQDIILDVNLTAEERSVKLEQTADNEVRRIQEMRRLEDDEKQMFGLDISSYIDDVAKADNPWLSSDAIKRLVSGYIEERLGTDRPRLTDTKIRLTLSDKSILADDYKILGHNADNPWIRYLKGRTEICNIAYIHETAKDQKTLYLSPIHPLVRQAAAFYATDKQFTVAIEVSGSDIAPGTYPFQYYLWDYTGGKPRTQLIPICSDNEVRQELSAVVQNAVSSETEIDNIDGEFENLAEHHLELWQNERAKYKTEIEALYRFQIESLLKSIEARKNSALHQINETANEKIKQMRMSEIERLDAEFAAKKEKMEEGARLADIHTTLLVNGVLRVKEEFAK